LVLTSGVSVVTAFDGGLLSVLSPAVNKSVSVTDFLSSPLIRSYGGSLHSAKLPSAPNHRLCNGDRQDRRMERRTSFTRRIGVVLAARQYGCRCRCCDCWTAPRITCILAGSKQTLPPRCGLTGDCDSRAPANSFAGGHLDEGKSVCGPVLQRFQGQLGLDAQCD
jgi:hypothetical protein